MAQFKGTIQEYHDFIGPRIRNKVNNLTRSARLSRNKICEHCGQERELQSAHVHGYERRTIIDQVLSLYELNDVVLCDIGEVEWKILDAHKPVERTFLFLCQGCHTKYDKKEKTLSEKYIEGVMTKGKEEPQKNEKFSKLGKIEIWADRPHQINHKIIRAYLYLEKQGEVSLVKLERNCSNPDFQFYVGHTFKNNFSNMKTDSANSHGKVFRVRNGIVDIYPIVREEIKKWFGE